MIKTHTREQVMYSLDIGSDNEYFDSGHVAMVEVAKTISKVTGGLTLVDCIGYWADVVRADKESYEQYNIGCESNVQLQVKAETSKEELVEETIVKAIIKMSHDYPELGINWVCGHKVTRDGLTVAFNFSVHEQE